ncbi:MAG: hypothetical protein IT522_00020 [Burkholderiales bacterium]|nr:hypothetical protein [Burkholderiales bacterium]
MEVRWVVIAPEHLDENSIERADGRHFGIASICLSGSLIIVREAPRDFLGGWQSGTLHPQDEAERTQHREQRRHGHIVTGFEAVDDGADLSSPARERELAHAQRLATVAQLATELIRKT